MSTATTVPSTVGPRPAPAPWAPSLGRLVRVELRKSSDTRAGRWLLLVIALATAAPTPQMPSSPTPLAFIGDEIGSVSSRKITSWCGMSAWTGTS